MNKSFSEHNVFQRQCELSFEDENTTCLIILPNRIVVNRSRDFEGISAFTYDLELSYEILFPIDESFIYSWFKKFSNDRLLFYCPEYSECIIHVDLKYKKSSLIPLGSYFSDIVFSPVYWWEEDILILSGYNDDFFQVSTKDCTIDIINKDKIANDMPLFYAFYREALSQKAVTIYSSQYEYIFIDEVNNTLNLINCEKKWRITVPNKCPEAYDYEYKNEQFLCVSEKELMIIDTNKEIACIKPEGLFRYTRANFLEDRSIIALSSHNAENKLTKYGIK